MYNKRRANQGLLLLFIGFNTLYFPLFIVGMMGMPRRYYDYLPEFTIPNVISTIGSFILFAGLLMIIVNLIRGGMKGEKVGRNPWGGKTLEWQAGSPPSLYNFDETPEVTEGPYVYNK
jgi:cytochrome c oxidase subunit I